MDAISRLPNCADDELVIDQDLAIAELLAGLNRHSGKYINSKFFYDEAGSQLFNQITTLPEYYLTRTELDILQKNAPAIADCVGSDVVLIEPGAGACEKVRYLLKPLKPIIYVPQDISGEFLYQTAGELKELYPWLQVSPLVGDFAGEISLPDHLPENRRILFYPGSTIGNFEPTMAVNFLRNMRSLVGDGGGVVIGVDLQKDPEVLNAAYNDSAGVTAEFNRNILRHANNILGTTINVDAFLHEAFYNSEQHRIEMHLVCEEPQQVNCGGQVLHFAEGETVRTEFSYKYTENGFEQLAGDAGFRLAQRWLDDDELFSVCYLE